MRITEIELNNFRAFYGKHTVKLDSAGKNLLVYGENGSGKSSLYHALKLFFQAGVEAVPLQDQENIFIPAHERGSVSLHLKIKEDPAASGTTTIDLTAAAPQVRGAEALIIADANKIKAFFDYKSLLKTHFNHKTGVNIFHILVKEILPDAINRFTGETFGAEWRRIVHEVHNEFQSASRVRKVKDWISQFNNGLEVLLGEIEGETNTFLNLFGINVKVSFKFDGVEYVKRRVLDKREILVKIEYCDEHIPKHQYFLNEARLSALAISLYLASIRVNPSEGRLKVLVLDDLLIGLDMSNRIPLLNIIQQYFQDDYQIIMTTYDKVWFEVVRNYFADDNWKYIEIYSRKLDIAAHEFPVILDPKGYLVKAQEHLANNDYKAAAVYIRTEFERLLKLICQKRYLKVEYNRNPKKVNTDHYLQAVKNQLVVPEDLVREIETHRGTVMNPMSHDNTERPEFRAELENTIAVVERLTNEWNGFGPQQTRNQLEAEITRLGEQLAGKDRTIAALRARLGGE